MSEFYIGIDSGTQGTKVLIIDNKTKSIVVQTYAAHDLMEGSNGKKEQYPSCWIFAIKAAFVGAFQKSGISPKDVRAIGVSGQQHGFVPLDKGGNVIRPAKLWCDTATITEANALVGSLGGEAKVIDLIGNSIAVGFTASKVAWLKEHEPENYDRLDKILLPHDYINYWLTGEKKTECGDASGTAFFDVRKRTWSAPVLNAIDSSGKLQNCLPELISSEAPVGKIRPELCDEFGFSNDTLVSSGGGDNMMAAIGTGNVLPGIVTASLGTSGTIYCFSEKPIVDPNGELAAFCSSDGHWLPLVCTMNVTVSTELTRNLLGMDINSLNQNIESAPVGSDGLILLPYFNGERTPALPAGRATLFGMNTTNYTQENVCRSAMEGATFGLRYGLDIMKQNGIQPNEIRLIGGGSKSKVWRRIVSEIFNCPVVCPDTQEAGALGAALQALWCRSHYSGEKTNLKDITKQFVSLNERSREEPCLENTKSYDEVYDKYLALNESLKAIY